MAPTRRGHKSEIWLETRDMLAGLDKLVPMHRDGALEDVLSYHSSAGEAIPTPRDHRARRCASPQPARLREPMHAMLTRFHYGLYYRTQSLPAFPLEKRRHFPIVLR